MTVTAADRQPILDRLGEEPWATLHARLEARADEPLQTDSEEEWDHDVVGHNAGVAHAAALLAWLHQDAARAEVAIAAFEALQTDFQNNHEWDVNIRMPAPLIGFTGAWDLLLAGGFLDAEQEDAYAGKVITITDLFFEEYIDDPVTLGQLLGFAQNNHPLRTAAAVGVPGLAFRDRHPAAQEWLDWAASETTWLLGPSGQYVMADGAVSEGPYYYAFGLSAVLAFLVAMDNGLDEGSALTWDCRNRVDYDPFTSEGCEDGAAMSWDNPLYDPWFQRSLSWSMALRLPDGLRPPKADANLVQQNGGALVAAAVWGDAQAEATLRADAPAWVWDWMENGAYPADTTRAMDLTAQHLARLSPELLAAAGPPSWTDAAFMDGGDAVLRGGWGVDDPWVLFIAEQGAARKTLHDHVDGLSFSYAAYGEYLLLDPGYYKPSELDNARTADARAHNVILVDGQGAPDKGLLTVWGDADAWLERADRRENFAWAEAWQEYEGLRVTRDVILVRDRYLLVLDRLDPAEGEESPEAREITWRLGGYAGYDAGGAFEPGPAGARWERTSAGVDLHLASTRPGLSIVEPALVEGEAPHVHQFDLERSVGEHGVIDGVVTASTPGFVAALVPYRVGADGEEAPLQVEVLALDEGWTGVQVTGAWGQDLALVREADAPTTALLPGGQYVETDYRAVFLGAGGAGMLLAGPGTSLWLDGRHLSPGEGEPVFRVDD
ncbi:heparinase II/III-family protein [Myxococcota bacterium]|nr:heparinase II/III-family protein [Myxococcota bacterium]